MAPPAPLFTSLFNYRHSHAAGRGRVGAGRDRDAARRRERTNYPLDVSVDDNGDRVRGDVDAVAAGRRRTVCALLLTAAGRPGRRAGAGPGHPAAPDRRPGRGRAAAGRWPDGTTPRGAVPAATLPELFAAQAARRPDAVAVACGDAQLTYARAGRAGEPAGPVLVGARGRGRSRWSRWPWSGPPSWSPRCWRCSRRAAAYLPLDPGYPAERIAFMLADAAPVALLTDRLPGCCAGGRDAGAGAGRPGPAPAALGDGDVTDAAAAAAAAGAPGLRDLHLRLDRAAQGRRDPARGLRRTGWPGRGGCRRWAGDRVLQPRRRRSTSSVLGAVRGRWPAARRWWWRRPGSAGEPATWPG